MFELRNVLEFFFGFSTTSSTQSSTKLLNKSQIEKQLTRDCYFLFNDLILPWSMKNWCQLQTERNILSMKYHNIFIHSTTSRWYKLNVKWDIFPIPSFSGRMKHTFTPQYFPPSSLYYKTCELAWHDIRFTFTIMSLGLVWSPRHRI